jgi:hypothetical protein
MTTQPDRARSRRTLLRTGSTLMLSGGVASLVVEAFHPSREPADDHPAVFAEYAASNNWIAHHRTAPSQGPAAVVLGLVACLAAASVTWKRVPLARTPALGDGRLIQPCHRQPGASTVADRENRRVSPRPASRR